MALAVTSSFHTVRLFDQKSSRKTAITTTAKTKKTEMNKHKNKQLLRYQMNQPIVLYIL